MDGKLETDESVQGGVKVRTTNESVTIENSLFDRLGAAKDDLASEVSKLLFADDVNKSPTEDVSDDDKGQ